MMHWYLNEQREHIMNVAREFAQNECRPVALEVDRRDRQPVELYKRAAELGFVGMTWPEEYGGLGLDNISYCLMYEEIAKELPVLNMLIGATSTLCGRHILDSGDPEQAKKYLIPGAKGDFVMAAGNCEPVGLRNYSEFQTRAVKDGDDWIINGGKIFTTNIGNADIILVSAVTAPEVDPNTSAGLSWFILEKGMPGLEIGKIEDKLGWHGSSTGSFFLKNVRVPKENLMGPENIGHGLRLRTGSEENMMIGCGCLGQAEGLYLRTWEYTHNRIQSGVSLFNRFQVIRHKLLKMRLEIDTLRALVFGTAAELDNNGSIIALGQMCKMKGVEVLEYVGKEAIQLHGGNGIVTDNGIDIAFRDAKVSSIAGGSIEAMYDMVLSFIENGREPVL
jgi:alkylation response protein AidB-like acyl-CoA dehydrogenase